MTMDRRNMLKRIGGAGTIGLLAGCISTQQQDAGGESNSNGSNNSSSANNGNNSSSSGTTGGTATIWYALSDTEKSAREQAIKTFNEQSNHAVEGGDISEMQKKTTSAIPAGQGPQTFEWAHDWVGDYYERGFLVDQSSQLSVNLDQFTNTATDAIQHDDAVLGLPHSAETVSLIYNTDIVDQEPKTFEEMTATMDDYHDPSNNKYGLSSPFDPYFASGVAQAFGGYYFDPQADPSLGLELDETIRGFEFITENLVPYMANDPGYEAQEAVFMEGNAAFAMNGPWYLSTLNENNVNYKVTTFPEIKDGKFNPLTGVSMWYFSKAMEKDETNAAAARKWVEWYTTNEDLIESRAKNQGDIPVLKSLTSSDSIPDDVQAYAETINQGTAMPSVPKMNDVFAAMEAPLVEIFNGNTSPENALKSAAKEARSNWD